MTTAPDPCQHLSPFLFGPKWYSAMAGADASKAANPVIAAAEIVNLRIVISPSVAKPVWVELISHKQDILKTIKINRKFTDISFI
jgi:hypothetical protein